MEQLSGLGTLKTAPDKANSFKSCILGGLKPFGAPGHQNGEEGTRFGGRTGEKWGKFVIKQQVSSSQENLNPHERPSTWNKELEVFIHIKLILRT